MGERDEARPRTTETAKSAGREKARPDYTPETDPALNNPDATPGTGMLPTVGDDEPNIQPSS